MQDFQSELGCRDVVIRAIRALDSRDYDGMAQAFAEDGVWLRGGETLVGPQAVRAALDQRPADLETQHVVANMIIDDASEGAAIVQYTLMAYAQRQGEPYHLHGIFKATDRLTRTEHGWRFLRREIAPAFTAQS